MTAIEIVKAYLGYHGYDGLCNVDCLNDECGCLIEDLAPCGADFSRCKPGYKVPCDCGEGCGFHVGERKPTMYDLSTPDTQARADALIRKIKSREIVKRTLSTPGERRALRRQKPGG